LGLSERRGIQNNSSDLPDEGLGKNRGRFRELMYDSAYDESYIQDRREPGTGLASPRVERISGFEKFGSSAKRTFSTLSTQSRRSAQIEAPATPSSGSADVV
jgi:hypothetical protein